MPSNNMLFTFLISSERSGSNLITRLLDGHSKICGPSATHLFRRLIEHSPRYGDLQDDEQWRALIADAVALFDSKMGHWNISLQTDDLVNQVKTHSLQALLRHIYEKEAHTLGKERVFVKENHAYRFFPFLDAFFDQPRFVWLVRDPRDMALSWKRSAGLRGCVIRAAETWKADQEASLMLYHMLQEKGRMMCIRYEDLISDSGTSLKAICGFLGLSFEDKMLELDDANRTRHHHLKVAEWANVHKPVMRTNYNKYKSGLSRAEVGFVQALCKDEMQALGYELEHDYPGSPEALREEILPLELYEKPDFQKIDSATRTKLAERVDVLNRIKQRPIQSVKHHTP